MMKKCVICSIAVIVLFFSFCITNAQAMDAISLSSGWNFISFPKQLSDPSMNAVLKDISSNVRVIWGYDNQTKEWLKYKGWGSASGSQRILANIESGKGYWIYMDDSGTIDITNWSAPLSATIVVYPGWNLTGYNGTDGLSVTDALKSISEPWSIIWNWADGTWYAKQATLNLPLTIQPVTNIYQGRAYWIRAGETTCDSCGKWDSSLWDNSIWGP